MNYYDSVTDTKRRLLITRRGRRGATLCLAVALWALIPKTHASALLPQTYGEAFDQTTNEFLYSEAHCVSPDMLAREVIYRDAGQQLIAYKELDYGAGSMTPSFRQYNLYSSDSVAVELRRDEVIMTAAYDDSEQVDRVVVVTPDASSPIVIDAGFDAFVIGNWDSLVAGQGKRFQFPVAAREIVVELSIESAPCSYTTESDQCFLLQLDNWLLRMVADSIELGYDTGLKRLARFRGVSNISDGSGSGYLVDIRYGYHDLAALQCEK